MFFYSCYSKKQKMLFFRSNLFLHKHSVVAPLSMVEEIGCSWAKSFEVSTENWAYWVSLRMWNGSHIPPKGIVRSVYRCTASDTVVENAYQSTKEIVIRSFAEGDVSYVTDDDVLCHIRGAIEDDVFVAPSEIWKIDINFQAYVITFFYLRDILLEIEKPIFTSQNCTFLEIRGRYEYTCRCAYLSFNFLVRMGTNSYEKALWAGNNRAYTNV